MSTCLRRCSLFADLLVTIDLCGFPLHNGFFVSLFVSHVCLPVFSRKISEVDLLKSF